jgi:hypothetical protein
MLRKTTETKGARRAQVQSTPPPPLRRDAAGHLDPKHKAKLRALSRETDETPDPKPFLSNARSADSLAEEFGESVITRANSGEGDGADARDATVQEELGGPFIETSSKTEFGYGVDERSRTDFVNAPNQRLAR